MRIVHFIDTAGVGGAETVMMQCVQGLQSDGHDVEVWHIGNDWVAEQCKSKGIKVRQVWAPALYKHIYTLPLFLMLFLLQIYRYRVTVLHSHIYPAISAVAFIAIFPGFRHIGTLHDTWFLDSRFSVRRIILKYAAATGTKLIVISNAMLNEVSSRLDIKPSRFFVVYNGTDGRHYHPAEDENNKEIINIVSVARLITRKRMDLIIDAVRDLNSRALSLHAVIVGNGELHDKLSKMINERGLSDCVHLLGERQDIADILRHGDIFLLPSDNEGLPCSIIEAMACGLSIIATDVGGVSELVEDGKNGYLFPAGDLGELVNCIEKLAVNSKLREQFGKASRQLFEERFDTTVMVANHLKVYRS